MSIQTITMSNLGETLTMQGLGAMLMLLKICVDLMTVSNTSELIGMSVPFLMYRILRIFKYNFD